MSARADDRGARGTVPGVVAVASALLAVSVFLPWYTADVAPPLSPESSSGWDSTVLGRAAFAAAIVTMIAAVLIILDLRDDVPLDREVVRALSWLCLVLSLGATALVTWRLIRPPGPAEFLARDVGLYIAMGCAVVALIASILVVRPRD